MKRNQINIVVLMSTYNGAGWLQEQIDSIFAQTGGVSVNLLVRDDGSKDDTVAILEQYEREHPTEMSVIKDENLGFALSFSQLIVEGLKRYPGCEYFAFCDQDDVWLPDKLRAATDILQKEKNDIPVTYCSNTTVVDEQLNIIRKSWKPEKVKITKERSMIQSFATGCTMVFNRVAAEIYVSHLPKVIKVHDYLMYQLCAFLGKVVWDANSYILYRQHGNNQIGKKNFKNRMKARCSGHYKEHALEYQNRYFLEAFKDLLSIEDISLLSRIVYYRTNIFTKLSLLLSNKIKYTSTESNLFYRIKILLGGV